MDPTISPEKSETIEIGTGIEISLHEKRIQPRVQTDNKQTHPLPGSIRKLDLLVSIRKIRSFVRRHPCSDHEVLDFDRKLVLFQ